MATERVDKNWQQRELDQFSINAILGTLSHYGVQTDEKAFVELAQIAYPIGIAHQWQEGWRGTGQFLRFPVAAAEELWHRLLPGQVAPVDIALALINLLKTLDGVLGNKKDEGMLETRFKVVENYVAKVPARTRPPEGMRFVPVATLADEALPNVMRKAIAHGLEL